MLRLFVIVILVAFEVGWDIIAFGLLGFVICWVIVLISCIIMYVSFVLSLAVGRWVLTVISACLYVCCCFSGLLFVYILCSVFGGLLCCFLLLWLVLICVIVLFSFCFLLI